MEHRFYLPKLESQTYWFFLQTTDKCWFALLSHLNYMKYCIDNIESKGYVVIII